MQQYSNSLFRQFPNSVAGNAAVGVSVHVYELGTTNLVTLYADDDVGGATLPNPLTTNDIGFYSFYAPDGKYTLHFGSSQFPDLNIQLIDALNLVDAFNTAIDATGYILVDNAFSGGYTVTQRNEALLDDGVYYVWKGALPKVITAGSSVATTGGIGNGAWQAVLDNTLEQRLIDGIAPIGSVTSGEVSDLVEGIADGTALIAGETAADVAASVNVANEALALAMSATAGIIYVEDYRIGPMTDTGAVLAAFDAATHGQQVQYEAGRLYVLTQRITVDLTARTLYVNFNGSISEFTDGEHGYTFKSDWLTIQTFTGLRSDSLAIQNVSNPTTFAPKNYIRIFSDDLAPDARASGAFQCEEIYLESISGTTLAFLRPSAVLYGRNVPYATNPRVAQRTGNRVVAYNAIVRHPDSATIPSWKSYNLIDAIALTNPIFYNISSPRSVLPTLELKACVNAILLGGVDGKHDDLAYPGDVDTYGYGVRDCSLHTKIIGRAAYRVRHAADTHEQNYGANAAPEFYGSSVGMRVIGCSAVGTTGSSFTTHHQARGAKFIGCIAQDSFNDGYGLRGEVELHDCESYRCRRDTQIFDEDNAIPARTWVKMYNHTARMSGILRNDNKTTPVDVYNYSWLDGHLQPGIWCSNTYAEGVLRFHGTTHLRPSPQTIAGQALFGVGVKGVIEFDKVNLDLNRMFTSYVRAFDVRAAGAADNDYVLKGNLMRVFGAGVSTFFNRDLTSPPTADKMRFNLVFDANVAQWTGGAQNNQSAIQVSRDNDVVGLCSVTVLNPDNQFASAPGQVRTVNLSFGTVAAGAESFTNVSVFGFALNTPALINAICTDNRLIVEKATMQADSSARIFIRNRTGASEVLDNIPFTIVATKL